MCFTVVNLYIFLFSTPVFRKINFYFEENRRHGFVAFFPNLQHADKQGMSPCAKPIILGFSSMVT